MVGKHNVTPRPGCLRGMKPARPHQCEGVLFFFLLVVFFYLFIYFFAATRFAYGERRLLQSRRRLGGRGCGYASSNDEEGGVSRPGSFLLPFFAPVRNEQLGLCLLIIRLVWFSLFMLQTPLRPAVVAVAAAQE